ncbi:ABC transporter substrate-binding protein [Bacillus sp. SD075]|uniref:ABC transporter substrate-binding protein n=1 Tax=Bacillus sp. SD075 TaxID=2781732 RepID=UPI001A97A07D|nr:ABC transporter substrate-binding protein [Bacillus sp. SD075]MBO1000675.1 ABC transporter substrate-binding protein [Bacillus sp. SD075]
MKRKKKIIWLVIGLIVLFALTGFFKMYFFNDESSLDLKKVRIGYVNRDTFIALKNRELVEEKLRREGITVEWTEFEDEIQIYQALEQGSLDFGKVGDAVPAFLHSGKKAPLYLAAEPSNPNARAIAVSVDSGIKGIEDLIGKKVAYAKFSNEHYFLLQMLTKNGLGVEALDEIDSVEVSSEEARELFEKGEVDAWIVSEPEVSQLEDLKYPLLFDNELEANSDVYLTTKDNIKERKRVFITLMEAVSEFDEYLTNDIHLAAEDLFQNTKIAHAVWLSVFERETYGSSSFFNGMIQEQQEKVDFLFENQLIKKNFRVADEVVILEE